MKIHSVESLAALDGEGIRYALFLGGCPLRCVYCHNPDTWCGAVCEDKTPEQLVAKIRRYKPYFKSGGGVTFSGGEPLLQAEEIVGVSKLLTLEGISYTIDTSGHVPLTDSVKKALDGADLVIVDLKFATADEYKKYTGGDMETVLSFLDFLVSINKRIWLRTVIIPGINDTERDIDRLLQAAKPFLGSVQKYELLGFHTMGFFKYEKSGIVNPLLNTPALSPDRLKNLQQYLDSKYKEHYI